MINSNHYTRVTGMKKRRFWEMAVEKEPVKMRTMWGDIAKGIAIILVIAGHTLKPGCNACRAIFLFHMPLFFLIAGYFFNFEKYKNNFKGLITGSYNRIIIPAIFTFLLFRSVLSQQRVLSFLYASGKPIPEIGISSMGFNMWFLFCLVVVRILLWAFLKLKNEKSPLILNLIIAGGIAYLGVQIGHHVKLPWSIDIALAAFYIAYAGYELKMHNFFEKKYLGFIIVPLALVLGYIDYKYFGLSMNERNYSNYPLVSLTISIILCTGVIYISKIVEKIGIVNKIFAYLGINSLIIMLFHTVPQNPHSPLIWVLWRLFICAILISSIHLSLKSLSILNFSSINLVNLL